MINWAWKKLNSLVSDRLLVKNESDRESFSKSTMQELCRTVFVFCAGIRLIRFYILDLYPLSGKQL